MDLPGITQAGPLLVLSLITEPERTALCDGMISSCMIISVIMHILLFVRFKENPVGNVCEQIKVLVKDVRCFTVCSVYYRSVSLLAFKK
jgi:hypothetical protein